ncbi:hypothetical protein CJU90_3460 [Yarrowia sp. C11]|nr:hypothetical protein CKK34_4906 [Yarrowia sp. E02]KAG5369920.1 hypothetical protein CJU90_3460 [Yarrowia sp. C11]
MSLPFPVQIDRDRISSGDDLLAQELTQFKTLEDLKSEFGQWIQILENEVVELINKEYQQFVALGNSVSGGNDRVQEIKHRLVLFQRQVEQVKQEVDATAERTAQVLTSQNQLLEERQRAMELILYIRAFQEVELRVGQVGGADSSDPEEVMDLSNQLIKLHETRNAHPEAAVMKSSASRLTTLCGLVITALCDSAKTNPEEGLDLLRQVHVLRRLKM